MSRNPLILALDLESADQARRLVRTLGPVADFYKVGLELFSGAGPDFVRELIAEGKHVFLDLKMYDIPETVRRAVQQAAALGVRFLTVHAVPQVMRAAVDGRAGSQLKILGVTVLTSLDSSDLAADGYQQPVEELVALRIRNAVDAKVDGVVCSPLEVARVRAIAGTDMITVVPGVRSAGAVAGDQKRVATPAQAMANGANYLVIGRQVTRAADPVAEVRKILDELKS